jgi:peptide/nickel transport system permease protein
MKLFGRHLSITGAIGIAIVAINLVAVALAPWITHYGQAELVGNVWAPPSAENWLGLDNLGRDMLARLLYGGRVSIVLAFLISALACAIGITLGFIAVAVHPWLDQFLSRAVDVLIAVPQLVMALVILSVMGTSIPVLILTIAILESLRIFRVARGVAAGIVVLDYVEIAKLRGEHFWWVIFREMLPNAVPPLLAEFGIRFCFTLLFVASLSFLGLGIQPPNADWGSMVRENALAINFGGTAPLIPAAAIALLTIGVNLVVDMLISTYSKVHGEDA